MKKVGFGIIGTGAIATMHADAIRHSENAELAAVYDLNAQRAESFAQKYGTRAVSDFGAFLGNPEIEAVTIATPSGFHHDPAVAAAKAKKHILCEKPLEITLERADDLIRTCDENKVLLATVFQSRFKRPVQEIKKALDEGRFGNIVSFTAQRHWFRDEEYFKAASWRGTWKVDGGGALMNQGIHTVDLLLYLGGDVRKLYAHAANRLHTQIETEDTIAVTFEYVNGAVGTLECSTACKPGFPALLEITGTRGSAVLTNESLSRWVFDEERPEDAVIRAECGEAAGHTGGASSALDFDSSGHQHLIDNLAKAIRQGEAVAISGREGRRAVEFVCAAYESNRSGMPAVLR